MIYIKTLVTVPLLFSAAVSNLLLLYFSNITAMSVAHIACPSQVKAGEMGQTRRLRCGQREGRESASVMALAQMSLQLYKVL